MKYVILSSHPHPAFWYDRLVNGRWQEGWTTNLEHARKYTKSNMPPYSRSDQVITLDEARLIAQMAAI